MTLVPKCKDQLSPVLVVSSAWCQGKELLSMGTAPLAPPLDVAGRGSRTCLDYLEEIGCGWMGRVGSQAGKSPTALFPLCSKLLPNQ